MPNALSSVDHIVVLMLENRSFDHMLGFLYSAHGNASPATGDPFEGLTGNESNPNSKGAAVRVSKIQASKKDAYYMPGADPGEGYAATNTQLFGNVNAPVPPVATNQGFIKDYSYTLGWEGPEHWSIFPGTTANDIMGVFTPEMLPVLSGLATGYAVCDHWFGSVPTETLPNRAFVCAGTSQGHVSDTTKKYTCPSIFGLLSKNNRSWAIYGYIDPPLTRQNFPDTTDADESHFGLFKDFQTAAANGTLPSYTFLEPSWDAAGNSQHPNYDVSLGEQLIHDVYYALRKGPAWNKTLLIITYDEHGGCYDHVPPPQGGVPPDNSAGEDGFDFKRFGPRVPTVLVSPRIPKGTVFRVAAGTMPLDHTSILKTVETRWNLPNLTARDAAAEDIGAVLTLGSARTDDPLAGVVVPKAGEPNPFAEKPSHLQQVHAELVSQLPVPDKNGGVHHVMPLLKTNSDYRAYIRSRTEAWKAAKKAHDDAAAKSEGAQASTGEHGAYRLNQVTKTQEGGSMDKTHSVVGGSKRTVLAGAKLLGPANAHTKIEVTLKLRRMKELPELDGRPAKPMSREDLEAYGASEKDIKEVTSALGKYGLAEEEANAATRSVRLSGTVAAMEKAFQVKLFNYAHESGNYRGRVGEVRIPSELQNIVQGVFGLDNRRVARRKRRPPSLKNPARPLSSAPSSWYTGSELAKRYDYPGGDGSGQAVGVLEFGGGYFEHDLQKFCKLAGISALPTVKPVSTDGTSTSAKDGAEGEVMLDVELLASVCPKSAIVVYFSAWSEQGWISAFDAVMKDKENNPGAISISWGSPEDTDIWTSSAMTQISESLKEAAYLGITICVAAGDDGSSDAVGDGLAHADFPSSSPYVLSVGGTTVLSPTSTEADIVWKEGDGLRADNGGSTGGGVSAVFPRPTWQSGITIQSVNPGAIVGRCLPDLAANADWTASPYLLVVDGKSQPNGGTSAATPLVASLITLINENRGAGNRIGYITPLLYEAVAAGKAAGTVGAAGCTDVDSGNNSTDAIGGYSAGPGYDAVSGWGTPNGQKLLGALPPPAASSAHATSVTHHSRASHASRR